jgi:ketosteroid isomerase-like protein
VTPEDLVQIEAVKRLKYAYLRCIDQKDFDALTDLFTEDATAAYSGGKYVYEGRSAIIEFIATNMGREAFHSSHRVHHPEIELDGDTATGRWALEDTVLDTDWNFLLMGAAFYEDRYRRVEGEWRIEHTGYRRSFEFMLPTSALEGFSVTASWWATDGQSTLPVQ